MNKKQKQNKITRKSNTGFLFFFNFSVISEKKDRLLLFNKLLISGGIHSFGLNDVPYWILL